MRYLIVLTFIMSSFVKAETKADLMANMPQGSSMQDVENAFGTPTDIEYMKGSVLWDYDDETIPYTFAFDKGKLIGQWVNKVQVEYNQAKEQLENERKSLEKQRQREATASAIYDAGNAFNRGADSYMQNYNRFKMPTQKTTTCDFNKYLNQVTCTTQ